MSITSTGVETVLPADLDRDEALDLERILAAAGNGYARLVSPSGESHVIPPALCALLTRVVRELAAGNSVTVAPSTKELSTQQAAEVLGVSRPFVVRLLEEGRLAFRKVGTHRRVALADVVAYKEQQKKERRAAMEELTKASLDAGLEI